MKINEKRLEQLTEKYISKFIEEGDQCCNDCGIKARNVRDTGGDRIFKAGYLQAMRDVEAAWIDYDDKALIKWLSENLEKGTFGDHRHFFKFNRWLKQTLEERLGDVEENK